MASIKLKVSVMDCEPMGELVEIICNYPREDLPPELDRQLKEWSDKYLTDEE